MAGCFPGTVSQPFQGDNWPLSSWNGILSPRASRVCGAVRAACQIREARPAPLRVGGRAPAAARGLRAPARPAAGRGVAFGEPARGRQRPAAGAAPGPAAARRLAAPLGAAGLLITARSQICSKDILYIICRWILSRCHFHAAQNARFNKPTGCFFLDCLSEPCLLG